MTLMKISYRSFSNTDYRDHQLQKLNSHSTAIIRTTNPNVGRSDALHSLYTPWNHVHYCVLYHHCKLLCCQ
ncbi:hypothetical protein [Saguinine gammaherpesvirus 1]|uniref:Uncharacterized protein n=1 Tax=Saguinine gammaherpesvirus 1 TaxID=2169901 RepID=A0A9Q8QTC7_9GAMA|nr:hypothetical protein [Saguinine gammaherpesvirus 1]